MQQQLMLRAILMQAHLHPVILLKAPVSILAMAVLYSTYRVYSRMWVQADCSLFGASLLHSLQALIHPIQIWESYPSERTMEKL